MTSPVWPLTMVEKYSSLRKATSVLQKCMMFIDRCRGLEESAASTRRRAENFLIKCEQQRYFAATIEACREVKQTVESETTIKPAIKRVQSALAGLNPFLDAYGVLRVGGRLRRAEMNLGERHPVILPKNSPLTVEIIRRVHADIKHQGSNWTLGALRQRGYWTVGGRHYINTITRRCVPCRKYRGTTVQPRMADLPRERLGPAPPFTSTAVDLFGPFQTKVVRTYRKRWGCIFVCMASRAIHLEMVDSLDVSSFINAYRRFNGRRGPIRELWSDRGTNFVGAEGEMAKIKAELKKCPEAWRDQLELKGCDWLQMRFNIPKASHMGGAWERLIRTVRAALMHTLLQHEDSLTDDLLRTLFVEAEALVNSRPVTFIESATGDDPEPLSPGMLLSLKSETVKPMPGAYVPADKYAKQRWRAVQFLSEQFWFKWRREVIPEMTRRTKWTRDQRNLRVGDVVLVTSEGDPRGHWPLGLVTAVYPGDDDVVRKVQIKMRGSHYDRPANKMVLLVESGDG